jgi:hypothetical protein
VNVLFVGNSLTTGNEVPAKVTALAQALSGTDLRVTVVTRDGASLTDHLRSGDVQRALQERRFDIVVLQDTGGFPLCDVSFPGCATAEAALKESAVVAKTTGAQVVLYGTWQSKASFQPTMSALASKMAMDAGVQFVDVGAAIWKWSDVVRPALLPDGHPSELGSWIVATALLSVLVDGPAPRAREIAHCVAQSKCFKISTEDLSAVLAVAWQGRQT